MVGLRSQGVSPARGTSLDRRAISDKPEAQVLKLRYLPVPLGADSCKKRRDSSKQRDHQDRTRRRRSLAMILVADSVPGLKKLLATTGLKETARLLVLRTVISFLLHPGRMSCLR